MFRLVLFLSVCLPFSAFAAKYPTYFVIDNGGIFKVVSEENDEVTAYIYTGQWCNGIDPNCQWSNENFVFFQNLSHYAQKIDYFMEGPGKHYVSVTDESGHTVIYKWNYQTHKFKYWG